MGTWGAKDVKQVHINADTDGDNPTLIALPADKPSGRIVVVGCCITLTAAGVMKFEDTDGNLYFEVKDPGVSYAGTFDAPFLIGTPGKGLRIENPAAVDTNGTLTYFID